VLREAGARTVVDVRRFPASRRNPQFNQAHAFLCAETSARARAKPTRSRSMRTPAPESCSCAVWRWP